MLLVSTQFWLRSPQFLQDVLLPLGTVGRRAPRAGDAKQGLLGTETGPNHPLYDASSSVRAFLAKPNRRLPVACTSLARPVADAGAGSCGAAGSGGIS